MGGASWRLRIAARPRASLDRELEQENASGQGFLGLVFPRLQPHRYLRSLLEELTSFLWLHGHGWHHRRILLEPYVGRLLGAYLQRLPLRVSSRGGGLIVDLSACSVLMHYC